MKITVDSLERYGDWLNGIAKDASEQLKAAVFEYAAEMESQYGDISGWNREQIKELRDFTADMMIEVWHTHGDASASVGSMMFEETVGEDAPDLVMLSDQVSEDRARASAKYWAKHLFGDDASIGKFVEGCMSFVDRNVSHAADVQMIELSDELAASGKEIRYARVPRGPSCGFCIMLASRGFVYASKKTAGDLGGAFNDFHDRCDCRVIAGYEGLEVEGYDYQGMYERYRQCRTYIGDTEKLKKEWRALTPDERDQYGRGDRVIPLSEDPEEDAKIRNRLGKQADGFNDFVMRRIVHEMDSHDREWLYSGTCKATRMAANPKAGEIRVQNPDIYKEWQFFASRARSMDVDELAQRKHVPGSDRFVGSTARPSWFIIGTNKEISNPNQVDNDCQDAIYDASIELARRCAGTGYPDIDKNGNWRRTETVPDCGEEIGVTAGSGKPARGIRIHYSPKHGQIHAVPYRERFEQ